MDQVKKYPTDPEMNSGPSERDKVIDPDPPEVNSGPPEQDKVTKYPTFPGMNSGPPEREVVYDEENFIEPHQYRKGSKKLLFLGGAPCCHHLLGLII